MDGFQLLDSLEFDNHCILYQQIDPVAALQLDAIVNTRHALFRLDPQTVPNHLELKARSIRRFQQPRTEPAMNRDRRADDLIRDFVDVHPRTRHKKNRALHLHHRLGCPRRIGNGRCGTSHASKRR
jgi:hypothetical protein